MDRNYSGNIDTKIKLLMAKIQSELNKPSNKSNNLRNLKNSFISGNLSSESLKKIFFGLETMKNFSSNYLDKQEITLTSSEKDTNTLKKDLYLYKSIIEDFTYRISDTARIEYSTKEDIEELSLYSQIIQAARDGILMKTEKRQEIVDGKLQEVLYETTISVEEVKDIMIEYKKNSFFSSSDKIESYMGIGLGVAGIIGSITKEFKNKQENKISSPITKLALAAVTSLRFIQDISIDKSREELFNYREIEYKMRKDLYSNEQVSKKSEDDAIQAIANILIKEQSVQKKRSAKQLASDLFFDITTAIISGIYINKRLEFNENGKINGKSLAAAILSLQATKGISKELSKSLGRYKNYKSSTTDFNEVKAKLRNIMQQMEKKVFPLVGAKEAFDSFKLTDLNGKFYPKKNFQNHTIHYETRIKIPEFSMQRGDIVLLSGESGAGKSTFLRLLKRGDINNRNCITLDNGKTVDNLGSEYISFRPNMDLGNENNVLFGLTGKNSISDLSEIEKKNLTSILSRLHLDVPNLLEQLASRKFMEFSTGQQRRLALSKLFYRINDATSVVIVDEPVGNVEDKLIREQLELITQYAKEKNLMLLLTTHRIDLAENLVNKRYHINNNGVLEQVPLLNNKDKNNNEER